jgi:hypothetical protein
MPIQVFTAAAIAADKEAIMVENLIITLTVIIPAKMQDIEDMTTITNIAAGIIAPGSSISLITAATLNGAIGIIIIAATVIIGIIINEALFFYARAFIF